MMEVPTEYSAGRLLDAAPGAMLIVDSTGTITYANDRVRGLLGYEPDALAGQPIEQLVPDNRVEEHIHRRETYMQDPEQRPMGVGLDLEAQRADGTTVPVDVSLSPIRTDDRVDVMAVVRDVSEQREHHRQVSRLREAASRLIKADTDEEVAELVATASTDIFGFESSVFRIVEGGNLFRPVAISGGEAVNLGRRPEYSIDSDTPVARAYQQGAPIRYDDVRDLDDSYDRGEARAAMYVPIGTYGVLSILDPEIGAFDRSDLGLATSLAANAKAVFDRIDHEIELQRQIQRLDEFASIVAHDLRSPLNVARGHLELATDSNNQDDLERVVDALDRMETIIEYTLTLAKQGNVVGETEPVSIDSLADDCWKRIDTPNADLEIVNEFTIAADPERLQHVFENLFYNALEHAGPVVTVRIGSRSEGNGFYLEDDGPGIPSDRRDQIFDTGYTTEEEGTGFGLAIVHRIATAHGWDVHVTDSPQGGARFEFTGVDHVAPR